MSMSNTVSVSLPDASSLFARLLAEENLTVKLDRSIHTAMFEPERRVLLLPAWQNLATDALLLFIAHEVGHALFTPIDLFTRPRVVALESTYGPRIVRMMINVVEDVRIERMIQAKYRGLSGTFSRGYHALLERSFFGFAPGTLDAAAWAGKTVPDRINLYAKVGGLLRLSLTETNEVAWFNGAVRAQTYDDVLDVVEAILTGLSARQRQQAQQAQAGQQGSLAGQPSQGQGQSQSQAGAQGQESGEGQQSGTGDAQASSDQSSDQSGTGDAQDGQPQDGQSGSRSMTPDEAAKTVSDALRGESNRDAQPGARGSQEAGDPFAVPSQEAANAESQAMTRTGDTKEIVVTPAKTDYLHLNDVSVTDLLSAWKMTDEQRQVLRSVILRQRRDQSTILSAMIAAFRANQSAWQARRVQVSRTGSIDPTKLAAYKLTDDLFLRRRSLPDAQNHGFVLHIDWSGSMEGSMTTVLWQVLHLIWFAESIRVPIDVYGFSDGGEQTPAFKAYSEECFKLGIGRPNTARLVQLYSSSANAQVRLDAQAFLLSLMLTYSHLPSYSSTPDSLQWCIDSGYYQGPKSCRDMLVAAMRTFIGADRAIWSHPYVNLGGTPLMPALYASIDTVRTFRLSQRVEQCISVWLTDGGDTHGLPVNGDLRTHAKRQDYYSYGKSDVQRLADGSKVFDPRSGKTYTVQGDGLSTAFALHRQLTGATVVCVDMTYLPLMSFRRVLPLGDVKTLASQLGEQDDAPALHSRRRRNRTGALKPKVLKQTRRNVVVRSESGTFAETGMLMATQRQFPTLGCDVYLVTHPDLWSGSVTQQQQKAAQSAQDTKSLWEGDDELTEEERLLAAEDRPQYRRVSLSEAVLSNVKHHAMRKFADLLVPYMAVGRADASV